MDILWSASTTMRNPERAMSFLQTAAEIEGEVWNDDTQNKYQTLLIKNRFYKPTPRNLSPKQVALLNDYGHDMSYGEAASIFSSKHYVDESMRGRTSFDPLEKLGLVALDRDSSGVTRVRVTDFGRMFLDGKIDLGEMVFTSLLKTQFPYPLSDGRSDYNIKPFICTLSLIKRVNELWEMDGGKPVGISREEFGIFVLSLKDYRKINETAEHLIDFRRTKRACSSDKERIDFVSTFITDYLSNFDNAEKNIREYTDNMVRYLRLTRYIYIRGGGYYIDLEARRMIEINAILEQDNGSAIPFTTSDEYTHYISDYYAYKLPFETTLKLHEIANEIISENAELCRVLDMHRIDTIIPNDIDELKTFIAGLRETRSYLQNLLLKQDYQTAEKINEAINGLTATLTKKTMRGNKPSVELEKWANVALNILNDAIRIKPNAPLGDDNEPTFTAPANVPDIECLYSDFGLICEVTMLTGRDQWYNEGQPVMRHLRAFENRYDRHVYNFCLFVAPRIHDDTMNTFWFSVKYEYEGRRQKIVPITITALVDILQAVKAAKSLHRAITRDDLRFLYNVCSDVSVVNDSVK